MSIVKQSEIEFSFTVASVKTMVDGGIRIYIDLSEKDIPQAAMLMECKRQMIPLRAIIKADSVNEIDELLKKVA